MSNSFIKSRYLTNVRAGEKNVIGAGTTIKGKFSAKVMDIDYSTTEK
jgi:hypothetical protein